ncbi:MAG: dTDP-4-dehydrorhamnose reductase [Verrucomicrobiia bacterium]
MHLPRILLIGKNGQVGWELQRTLAPLGDVKAVDFPDIDLADPDSICDRLQDSRPDIIVNAAAYTAVDRAESDAELAVKVNGLAPGILAEEARRTGALLVHYSTDYVFDGQKRQPYVEEDTPNPLSVYGRSKLAGDKAISQVDCRHLIFRLCWVYSQRGHNFMRTIMRLAREREELRVVNDQIGAPTWARTIAEATALAVARTLSAESPESLRGTYHMTPRGATSWHGFAEAIVASISETERRCRRVAPIATAEYPLPARRPSYSLLSCEKLRRIFRLELPDWESSLRDSMN